MSSSTINWFFFRRVSRALWFLPALFSAFAILVVVVAYRMRPSRSAASAASGARAFIRRR